MLNLEREDKGKRGWARKWVIEHTDMKEGILGVKGYMGRRGGKDQQEHDVWKCHKWNLLFHKAIKKYIQKEVIISPTAFDSNGKVAFILIHCAKSHP